MPPTATRLALIPLTLLAAPAAAQRVDEQLWSQANGSAPLGDGMRATVESIARFGDRADGLAHTELGLLLTRKLKGGIEIAAGYRHIQDYDHDRRLPNEERTRQMVTVPLGAGLSTRVRLEQRFLSAGPQTGLRWRQQLRLIRPIGPVSAFASHESFVNLNTTDWGQRAGYERMRNAIGLQLPLADAVRGEAGYLNQYRFGRGGARDQMDHILTFAISLDL